MKNSTKVNSQPVHQIRHGAVTASIWQQETDKGTMFNVTFQRAYKEGDEWKHSGSFGRKDLLVVGFTATRAFEWIADRPQKAKTSADSPKRENEMPS